MIDQIAWLKYKRGSARRGSRGAAWCSHRAAWPTWRGGEGGGQREGQRGGEGQGGEALGQG